MPIWSNLFLDNPISYNIQNVPKDGYKKKNVFIFQGEGTPSLVPRYMNQVKNYT